MSEGGFAGVRHIPTDDNGMPLNAAMVSYGSDTALAVNFWDNKGKDYIQITIPGGKTRIDRKCTDEDIARFPFHWERYRLSKEGVATVVGTPLDGVSFLNEESVLELKAKCVTTIEQLASLNDHAIQSLGPGTRQQVTDARIHLATQHARALDREREENENLRATISDLQAKMAMILDRLPPTETKQTVATLPLGAKQPAEVKNDTLINRPKRSE